MTGKGPSNQNYLHTITTTNITEEMYCNFVLNSASVLTKQQRGQVIYL